MRSAAWLTGEFKLGVGLHQGSAFSPFLFAVIMDKLTEDISKNASWDMLFADDIVLSRQNHRELEDDLEIRRNALKRRSLKVSRSKTEYLKAGDVDDGEELKLLGEKLKRRNNFKYLGSTVSNDARCEEEVRRRIQERWIIWKKLSGVLCDRKLSASVKGKMYKSVVRPAMLYGMETGSDRKTGGKNGSCRVENGEIGTGSDKKEQDRKRISKRDRKNLKARRQTSECKATLVWIREKERRRLRGKKGDGNGGAR